MDIAAPLRPLDARKRRRGAQHPERLIAYSFATVIAIGTALLVLPFATAGDSNAPFLTALFTATSCVCVTGLSVVDTGTYWSPFGQVVMLLLIQVGGLGIMTLGLDRAGAARAPIGLRPERARSPPKRASRVSPSSSASPRWVAADHARPSRRSARRSFAVRMFFSYDYFPLENRSGTALFHCVSAFNNAGFGLLPTNISPWVQDWPVNLVVMTLIVAGGLGVPGLARAVRAPLEGPAAPAPSTPR